MGEGAGILILEQWEHAVARGATILAEVLGAASTADAHHITAPDPNGAGAVRCMNLALEPTRSSRPPTSHYINAHGTSTCSTTSQKRTRCIKVFGAERSW